MTVSRTYRVVVPVLVAALLVGVFVPRALAAAPADPRSQAKGDLVRGMALMDQGDYAGALRAFEAAYSLVPSPKIYFNLGIALQAMDQNAKALENFERFLKEATDVPKDKRDQAEQYRRDLRSKVASIAISADAPGADIFVDGTSRGLSPLAQPVYVEPGSHQIVAQKAGVPSVVQTFTANAGGNLTITVAFQSPPKLEQTSSSAPTEPLIAKPNEPESTNRGGITHRWWFWTAIGAAVVGGALTTFFATRSRGGVDCPRGFECPP